MNWTATILYVDNDRVFSFLSFFLGSVAPPPSPSLITPRFQWKCRENPSFGEDTLGEITRWSNYIDWKCFGRECGQWNFPFSSSIHWRFVIVIGEPWAYAVKISGQSVNEREKLEILTFNQLVLMIKALRSLHTE